MRKRHGLLSLLVAGGLAAAAGAHAQPTPGGMPCDGNPGACPHHGSGMGPGHTGPGTMGGGAMMDGRAMEPGMGGMHQPPIEQARLAELKTALKLQPSQMAAWDAFEAQAKALGDTFSRQRDEAQKLRGNPDAMAEFRVKALQAGAQAAERLNNARKALAAVLTPEQKAMLAQRMEPRGANLARLEQLKTALKLQPNQMAAWDAFVAGARAQREKRTAMMEQGLKLRDNPDALADFKVASMKSRAESAAEMNKLRQALAATLTPEQKATFDSFGRGPMGPGGPGGPGHRHGPAAQG